MAYRQGLRSDGHSCQRIDPPAASVARLTTAAEDDPDNLSAARGILTGIALSAVCWTVAFVLAALVFDGASVIAWALS